jgi:hypothetical protein
MSRSFILLVCEKQPTDHRGLCIISVCYSGKYTCLLFVTTCILVEESGIAGDYNIPIFNSVELPECSDGLFTQDL